MIIDLNEIPDLTLDLQIKIYSSGNSRIQQLALNQIAITRRPKKRATEVALSLTTKFILLENLHNILEI